MPGSAFRSSSSATATGSPATIVVSKPAGTVDGDLLVAQLFGRSSDGFSAYATLAGWTNITIGGNNDFGFNARRLSALRKVASGEGASWTFNLINFVEVIIIVTAWRGDAFSGSITSDTWNMSGATRDVTSPYQAGWSQTGTLSWGLLFSGVADETVTSSSLSFDWAGTETLQAGPIYVDDVDAAPTRLIARVYEDETVTDVPSGVITNSAGPATIVTGLWVPGFTIPPEVEVPSPKDLPRGRKIRFASMPYLVHTRMGSLELLDEQGVK